MYLSNEGLSGISVDINTTKAPNQIGVTSLGTTVDERDITLTCALVGDDEADLEDKRRLIVKTFNPLLSGRLEIKGNTFERICNCNIRRAPLFRDSEYRTTNNILFWQVTLTVPDNFLEDKHESLFNLSQAIPLIEFPFEVLTANAEHGTSYPPGDWFEFGSLSKGVAYYNNDSDASLPILIRIRGPVENPKITNETTGEFIEVSTPILANEIMFISTTFSDKSVLIVDEEGRERNAFNYVNLDSTFWQIQLGYNIISFDAEEGNDTADVQVYFKRRWAGI